MKIDIPLEWFLNADHLRFIAGIQLGWFSELCGDDTVDAEVCGCVYAD